MGSPFEEAKALLTGEKVTTSAPFMVNRILSFTPMSFIHALEHNRVMGRIPKAWSDLIFQCVPTTKRAPYLKYAKKKKEKEPKLVQKVCDHFCVNKYHADQIIDILRRQGESPEALFGLKKGE